MRPGNVVCRRRDGVIGRVVYVNARMRYPVKVKWSDDRTNVHRWHVPAQLEVVS